MSQPNYLCFICYSPGHELTDCPLPARSLLPPPPPLQQHQLRRQRYLSTPNPQRPSPYPAAHSRSQSRPRNSANRTPLPNGVSSRPTQSQYNALAGQSLYPPDRQPPPAYNRQPLTGDLYQQQSQPQPQPSLSGSLFPVHHANDDVPHYAAPSYATHSEQSQYEYCNNTQPLRTSHVRRTPEHAIVFEPTDSIPSYLMPTYSSLPSYPTSDHSPMVPLYDVDLSKSKSLSPIPSISISPASEFSSSTITTSSPPLSPRMKRDLRIHGFFQSVYGSPLESSSNYQLNVHDVPRKSRVETQVKLKLELVDLVGGAPSVAVDGNSATGSGVAATKWSFIKVPKTASVKMKSKGVCDPDPSIVLSLNASIYCATNPNYLNKKVPCCEACQNRERKRNSKKSVPPPTGKFSKSNAPSNAPSKNPTPATSDAEVYGSQPPSAHPSGSSFWGLNHAQNHHLNGSGGSDAMETDDYVSPIDFTCYQMVDFSGGSAQLSFRVVCYCRHYREKVGFCIYLTLKDHMGRLVGEVKTPPIMITDDHKSVQKLTPAHTADEEEADSFNASTRRKKRIVGEKIKHEVVDEQDEGMNGIGAIRNKRSSRILSRSSTGISKLTSTSSAPPSTASTSGNMSGTSGASGSGGPAIATTTNSYGRRESHSGYTHRNTHSQSYTQSESPLATTAPSSPSVGLSPPPTGLGGDGNKSEMDASTWNAGFPLFPTASNTFPDTSMNAAIPIMPMAGMALNPQVPPSMPPLPNPFPHITRVIPSSGSMLGGIEVTLFGSNFSRDLLEHAGIAFGENYVLFGDSVSGGAQVWSETVLICTLPPSALPGPVQVSLVGVQSIPTPQANPPPIFTYTEEGDKDLMMQALQMLGWQNSGQWQDPRSVAMNILTTTTQQQAMMGMENQAGTDFSSLLQGMSTHTAIDGKGKTSASRQPPSKLEGLVLNVLRSAQNPVTGIIGHISTPNPITGQTLLHIAAALGYHRLVRALIGWGAKVDVQDKNGFSPAHFACFYGRVECLDDLVRIGRAHLEGRDIQGRLPSDICGTDEIKYLVSELEEEVETRRRRSRAPSEIESGGEGDDEGIPWSSEADDDDEDDIRPAKVTGAEHPQPVSRRISRANSAASIASNRRISRSTTPFAPEAMMTPVTPLHPASTPTPTLNPGTTWGLPRNIPMPNIAMPWPMQLPAGWQFPNVPTMPQFARRRSGQSSSSDTQKDEKDETMFRWMMLMDAARSWGLLQAQQQQRLDSEMDPPPMYSPGTGATASVPQEKQSTSNTVGTPAVPTMLEEPPSPLTLDSPFTASLSTIGSSTTLNHSSASIRHRQQPRRREFVEQPIDLVQPPAVKTVVKRREKKQQDKMLYFFWIPVLLLVLAWASYKSLVTLYRIWRHSHSFTPAGPQPAAIKV